MVLSGLLDRGPGMPLYNQIFLILKSRIGSGELSLGDNLPSETELCSELGVSRITVKRALNDLADAGLVVRERGRGTRVKSLPNHQIVNATLEGWLENISVMGRETSVTVLDLSYIPATVDVAAGLSVENGAIVQRAVRVRRLEGETMSHLLTYVPAEIGRKYKREDLSSIPLLKLLEQAGVTVASARQSISATLADPQVATSLEISAGSPLIEVRRIVCDHQARPVEMIRALYRPEIYRFAMSMKRVKGEKGMTWLSGSGSPDDKTFF
jgi:GntR family transcriptional regulator